MDDVDLLLHPVRIRIVHAISSSGARTTSELLAQLADLAGETVESELNLLIESGIIEDGEHAFSVRDRPGALYAGLSDQAANDQRTRLTGMLGVFAEEVQAYLDRGSNVVRQDDMTLLQRPIWLTPAELAELSTDIARIVAAKLANEVAGRKRHFLNVTVLPSDPGFWD